MEEKKFYTYNFISINDKELYDCLELDLFSLGGIWSLNQWHEELTANNRFCFGLKIDKKLIALVVALKTLDELEILFLGVLPEFRNKKIGFELINYLFYEAKLKNFTKATLEVKQTNLVAKRFYKKYGFKRFGVRKKYYKDGTDAILYEINI